MFKIIFYSDCQFKEKKKDRLKKESKRVPPSDQSGMEVCPDSQIPASDYQKTVINYQNDDECINGKKTILFDQNIAKFFLSNF